MLNNSVWCAASYRATGASVVRTNRSTFGRLLRTSPTNPRSSKVPDMAPPCIRSIASLQVTASSNSSRTPATARAGPAPATDGVTRPARATAEDSSAEFDRGSFPGIRATTDDLFPRWRIWLCPAKPRIFAASSAR